MAIFKKKTAVPVEADVKTEAPKEVKKTAPKAKKEEKRDVLKAQGGAVSALAARTLLAPLVTEKTAHLADAGVYAFRVPLNANRVAVRAAFKELYKVAPANVNIMRVHGKESKSGRFASRASDWKKAMITLPAGSRVDIFAL
ncbi:MAG: 50S ribosomal protein L23 [Patescibacteria group bacterium]|jgi:large subunit ribosomal protein L23